MNTKYSIVFFLLCVQASFAQKVERYKVPKQPYYKFTLINEIKSDSITFYLTEFPAKVPQPLVVYIQGSGFNSLFKGSSDGRILPASGHINWAYGVKDKAKLLIVEKPGVNFLNNSSANPEFDRLFSLDSWAQRIKETIRYVIKSENIDTTRIMVVGHSEGGLVAAKVANDLGTLVSNVAILAGEGPSQLYSLSRFAEKGELFYTDCNSKTKRQDSLLNALKQIQSDPNSITKKFWGLTFLRWSTFLKTSVCEQLTSYNGRVFILQGTTDKNVYPESAIILHTTLLTKGKDVSFEMIPGADHSFAFANDRNRNGWEEVVKKCVAWFLP